MSYNRIISLTLIFILAVACSPQPTVQEAITSTPMLPLQTAVSVSPTPTEVPVPINATYTIIVKDHCNAAGGGAWSDLPDGGFALCLESPGFYDRQGNVDYYLIMVTHKFSSYRPYVITYDLLRGIIPTPTPGSTPTPAPTLPASILAKTPPGHIPPPPVTVRTITLNVTGYCEKPTSSTSMNQVTVCFAVPPGKDNQGTIEYWTITVTRDLTPTVKYGTFEWATPAP
jgi:hypothetical protein